VFRISSSPHFPPSEGEEAKSPVLLSLRICGPRKFSLGLKYTNREIDSRQGAKYAKFGGER
jgi:hypothetical protein